MTPLSTPESSRKRGARYRLDPTAPPSSASYLVPLAGEDKAMALITEWLRACRANENEITDDTTLTAALRVSRTSLYRLVKQLVKRGLVSVGTYTQASGARSAKLYTLLAPVSATSTLPAVPQAEKAHVDLYLVPPEADRLRIRMQTNAVLKVFRNSLLTLAPAFVYGNRKEVRKEAVLWFGAKHVEVVVRAYADSYLPRVADILTLIPIHSYQLDLLDRTNRADQPLGGCVVSTAELCETLNVVVKAQNKIAVYDRLHRFRADIEIVSDVFGVVDSNAALEDLPAPDEFLLEPTQGPEKMIKVAERRSFSLVKELRVVELTTTRGTTPEEIGRAHV